MIKKALHTIECHRMIAPGDKVIVALSGGADSMALAFFLYQMQERLSFSLEAVHINHLLRGAEAERDQAFVADWCRRLQIPCHIVQKDVAARAKALGCSVELAGRQVRYEVFASFGAGCKIATAHHLNDVAETILFRLARGTSPQGLSGIPPVRGNVIRPLIACTREEIEAYCAAENIPFIMDSTNRSTAYTRNQIRLGVIPLLQKLNPSFEEAVERFVCCNRADQIYLDEQSASAYRSCLSDTGLDCDQFAALPKALRGRVIQLFLKDRFSFTGDFQKICAVEDVALHGGRVQLSETLALKRFHHKLTAVLGQKTDVCFQIVNKLVLSRKDFLNISENDKKRFDFCGDYDKICGDIFVRLRLPGDRIFLPERGCSKSLKKYLNEVGVPAEQRSAIPVVADAAGMVGIAGLHPGRALPGADTERYLLLQIGEQDEKGH